MTKEEREKRKQTMLYFNGLTAVTKRIYYQMVNQPILPTKMKIKRLLSKNGINDSTSFKVQVRKFLTDGHHQEFNELRNELLVIPENEREAYIELFENDSEKQRKLKVVHEHFYRLPESTIAAYDYANYINYTLYGRKVGYVTKEEAWNNQLKAAKLAQQSYSGWLEFASAYYIGSQFCVQDQDGYKNYIIEYTKDIRKLIAAKHSPINQVEWELEL